MELKLYQQKVLERFSEYLTTLADKQAESQAFVDFQRTRGKTVAPLNWCAETWDALNAAGRLPLLQQRGKTMLAPYIHYVDGCGNPIPNVCLKVPTGGGKTYLATLALERLLNDHYRRQTGLVLWVVPTAAIFEQAWRDLNNRAHPYRHALQRASGGRLLLLEKDDTFTAQDIREKLCVLVIMLQSSARQSKDVLRVFRDTGNFASFFPPVDAAADNAALLASVPNLDAVAADPDNPLAGITVKHSLANVIRLMRPITLIDESQKAKSHISLSSLTGFNPCFILEITATPNIDDHESNVIVSVPGTALKDEEMIKVPINLVNFSDAGWQHTLREAHAKRAQLEIEAHALQQQTGRYIRPIMLIRVDRVGTGELRAGEVHANHVKEFLINTLRARPEEVRLKTSLVDEIAGEDLYAPTCQVRYIITKDALREGWDCHFAYVLTLLSRTTALTAMTQMVGRVLRQPGARLTEDPALDQCYVYSFDQAVTDAIDHVRKGLEQEGMADIAGYVQSSTSTSTSSKITVARRPAFRGMTIAAPMVLIKDGTRMRRIDYERDILARLPWDSFVYRDAHKFTPGKTHVGGSLTQVDVADKRGQKFMSLPWVLPYKPTEDDLDFGFLTRQVMELVPSAWQAARIMEDALAVLRARRIPIEEIFASRLDLVADMLHDLNKQIDASAESLFRQLLADGVLSFELIGATDPELDWHLAETIEMHVSDSDRVLAKRNGMPLERSLFECVYERDINGLERDVALYLDDADAIKWWHRLVARQDYGLQGWQRNKVFPDFFVMIRRAGETCTLTALETKGAHLIGNDDTAYKKRLFDLLTSHIAKAQEAGRVLLTREGQPMTFKLVLDQTWQSEIQTLLAA